MYEVGLNYFTCTVLVYFVLEQMKIRKGIMFFACAVLGFYAIDRSLSYYHRLFEVTEGYDRLYKIDEDEMDMLLYFNNLLAYEDERVIVVSQLDSIKGYILKTTMAFTYREFDKYALNESDDELMKIFFLRDFAGQEIFTKQPDFHCACDELIEHEIDYVIVGNSQVYPENGKFEHIYYLVRDCAELVYENDSYTLFRFYW